MTDVTIGHRIGQLMTFYAEYSKQADRVFDVPESKKDEVRYHRDMYARWIKEELDGLKELGINVEGFDYLKD